MVMGRRRQKAPSPQCTEGVGGVVDNTTAELDRIVKEEKKIVSANNNNNNIIINKEWEEAASAKNVSYAETPKASNRHNGSDNNNSDDDEYSTTSSAEEVRDENKSLNSNDDDDYDDEEEESVEAPSFCRAGASWDDEDVQENAFFEKSVKEESHQAVVKVLEHGNTQMLILEANPIKGIPTCSEPDDVVIKVDCSTITLQDCMIRRGKWIDMQPLPFIPGSDIVGTIKELGSPELNSMFKVGDLVAAVVSSGGNAKYAKLKVKDLLLVPKGVDSVTALCISSTYVPAKYSLELARFKGTPMTGANVLVVGANGPTALASIDLALMEGANLYAIADKRHHGYLRSLGVKKCFTMNPQKWLPELEGTMDVVLDSVCLDGYESSAKALGPSGKLICTGMSATFTQGRIEGPFGIGDIRSLKSSYHKARATYMMRNTFYYDKMESFREQKSIWVQYFKYLCHIHTKGLLNPVVAVRVSLTMVSSLQKAIEHGDTPYGVCVATPWRTREDLVKIERD